MNDREYPNGLYWQIACVQCHTPATLAPRSEGSTFMQAPVTWIPFGDAEDETYACSWACMAEYAQFRRDNQESGAE